MGSSLVHKNKQLLLTLIHYFLKKPLIQILSIIHPLKPLSVLLMAISVKQSSAFMLPISSCDKTDPISQCNNISLPYNGELRHQSHHAITGRNGILECHLSPKCYLLHSEDMCVKTFQVSSPESKMMKLSKGQSFWSLHHLHSGYCSVVKCWCQNVVSSVQRAVNKWCIYKAYKLWYKNTELPVCGNRVCSRVHKLSAAPHRASEIKTLIGP